MGERQQALREEKLREYVRVMEEMKELQETNQLFHYRPTAKQLEFHHNPQRLRLLMASNQSGKTWAAGAEVSMHMTGEYPDWWQGHRFSKPIRCWVAGVTGESTRDNPQRILLGPGREWGTGFVPKNRLIGNPAMAQGIADAVDHFTVRHKSGGTSYCYFKSYARGREKFQGETLHLFWGDEEMPYDIYVEALTRLNKHAGLFLMTFTPLMGMTEVVRLFTEPDESDEGALERSVIHMDLKDAEFYSEEEKKRVASQYPEHERRARVLGLPSMGEGMVFPIPDEMIACTPFSIPKHFRRIAGLDFGIDHPTAGAFLAYDPDSDTVYVYDGFKMRHATIADHCSAFRSRGCTRIPIAWPHDLDRRDPRSGKPFANIYTDEGLYMLAFSARYDDKIGGSQPVEPSIQDMLERMYTGRFKVFSSVQDFFKEKNSYHRKDGKIVPYNDDLISASRYAYMMLRYAISDTEGRRFEEWPQDGYMEPRWITT